MNISLGKINLMKITVGVLNRLPLEEAKIPVANKVHKWRVLENLSNGIGAAIRSTSLGYFLIFA